MEEFKKEIISIRVGEGITAIGNRVFADCINVEKLNFRIRLSQLEIILFLIM